MGCKLCAQSLVLIAAQTKCPREVRNLPSTPLSCPALMIMHWIKVEGEGEWNVRKRGGPKRRVWRKVHLGIDEQTLEIRASRSPAATLGMRPCCPSC